VTTDNLAYCWGVNSRGQLGDGTTVFRATPVAVAGGLRFLELSAGTGHTCGITRRKDAYCWGDNQLGQLGDGTIIDFPDSRPTPAPVASKLQFRQVTTGEFHTCGVDTSTIAYCWGGNFNFQLGTGTPGDRLTPARVAGVLRFRQVSAAGDHTCGVTFRNAAYCWGTNTTGELGDGTTNPSLRPVAVAAPAP
jgi:Regulator of chromosome condensation (RCC1) repeat